MKKLFFLALISLFTYADAQNVYWVFFSDKEGSTFDPYAYFDQKAIDRYLQVGADLYDWSNYPVSETYVVGVSAMVIEEVGQSRWLNAIGVVATPEQVVNIEQLPYVFRVQLIGGDMQLAQKMNYSEHPEKTEKMDTTLTDQVIRMQGHLFRQAGIDGRGVRIAVFDGGFPKVNTHDSFRHLRDNKQILKTWNFPNNKENVYGWNSHGTMTLSCIAGRMNGRDLGLATGAEFLLARTEIESEPFKEEIWWEMAAEWADRNGANIISSSLGYGKDRYYTKDMDGKSYVAKAANIAARKGILVVCLAGNEADDKKWQYLVTPSDADSALCIGGIEHSLTDYVHINFASYGPTADGRQKPNVCAFAHTWAASPKNDNAYEMVYGTSFSCPLVAGFAACAWQVSPGKTNMEMFDLIQRSADLYPYCDYAFGYGVPQASLFISRGETAEPTFRFEPNGATSVNVIPLQRDSSVYIFYKDVLDDGRIYTYGQRWAAVLDTSNFLHFEGGHRVVVHIGGYTNEYRFPQVSTPDSDEWATLMGPGTQELSNSSVSKFVAILENSSHATQGSSLVLSRTPTFDIPREKRLETGYYLQFGLPVALGEELGSNFWSPIWHLGVRWQHHFSKAYGWGVALEYGHNSFRFGDATNHLDSLAAMDDDIRWLNKNITKHRLNMGEFGVELFQRVRFVPLGIFHKGLHWDLGIYGNWSFSSYKLSGTRNGDIASSRTQTVHNLTMLDGYRWNYGVATRLTYDVIGIYACYRLSGIGTSLPTDKILLPRLEIGLNLSF